MDKTSSLDRSRRIELLRTVCILGIVILHIPPLIMFPVDHAYWPAWLQDVKFFISGALLRGTTPTLGVISGYLLFLAFIPDKYINTVKKKFLTLIVPLIIWNLPFVILKLYVENPAEFFVSFVSLSFWYQVLNFTIGIEQMPLNAPTHFLRAIFVCVLFCPIFYFVLKRLPYIGLAIMAVVLFFDLANHVNIRSDIVFSFYLGGLVATRRWDLDIIDRNWLPLLMLYVAVCIGVTAFESINAYQGGPVSEFFRQVLRCTGPIVFWGLSAWLIQSALSGNLVHFARYVFFIFCAHELIFRVLWAAWQHTVGDTTDPSYWLFYLLSPAAAVLIALTALIVLQRFVPQVLGILAVRDKPKVAPA